MIDSSRIFISDFIQLLSIFVPYEISLSEILTYRVALATSEY